VREFQPEKIVLFGSYAYGKPDNDSDVDLLVVMSFEGSPFRQAEVILNHVIPLVGFVPLDLLSVIASRFPLTLTLSHPGNGIKLACLS
jgi:predicted nucleotidyltransferase